MLTSPVNIPTSLNFFLNSRNFWLLNAFIGDVYKTLFEFLLPKAIPYSATTVFPEEVCAQTNTFWWFSRRRILRFWNSSNSKGNFIGGSFIWEKAEMSKSSSIAQDCILSWRSLKSKFIWVSSSIFSSFSWDSLDDSSFSFSGSLLSDSFKKFSFCSDFISFSLDFSVNFDISIFWLGCSTLIISCLSEFAFVEMSLGSSFISFCSWILFSGSGSCFDDDILMELSDTSGSWKSSKLNRSSSAINN